MTISPITNQSVGSTGAPPDPKQRLQSVADLFHMSTDDLTSELKTGKSLADIAKEKGVSRDDLVNTIKQDIQKNAPAGTTIDASKLDEAVNNIVDHKGGPEGAHHGHHHHHQSATSGDSISTDPSTTASQSSGQIFTLLA
jgi:lambda repressor-like predicted transcriptional regulator